MNLLKQRGILIKYGDEGVDEKDLKKVFDELNEDEFPMKEFYHDGLRQQVNAYAGRGNRQLLWCKRRTHKNRNPHLRYVLIVAILALLVAFLGTLFSVLSFFLRLSNKS